jgi:hypothetical protein
MENEKSFEKDSLDENFFYCKSIVSNIRIWGTDKFIDVSS